MAEETTRRGTEPPGYIGPTEHGPEPPTDPDRPRRMIVSAVWGGGGATVTSEHGQDVTEWNPDCSWYQYGLDLCLNGCQHPGMDIGIERGTALFAAQGGTVEFAGWSSFYRPHHVDIVTDDGSLHIYAHMWEVDPDVVAGARVEAGQYIGLSGEQTIAGTMEPDGSGAHLHFEVRSGGCAVDPEPSLIDAPIGGAAGFADGDRIEVVDGPLRMRRRGTLASEVVAEFEIGAILLVTGGPVQSDGFAWYQVRRATGGRGGWVAGRFCRKVD